MPFDRETNNLIIKLKQLREKSTLKSQKLIPFIGSGFSANISNFPLWSDFIDKLDNKVKNETGVDIVLNEIFHKNYMLATEYYYWRVGCRYNQSNPIVEGKKSFVNFVDTEFTNLHLTTVSDVEWKQHIILINKFKKIYTTNWDTLLEETAYQRGCGYEKYVCKIREKTCETITPYFSNGNKDHNKLTKIYKYHGCCKSDFETIVASESDYYDRIELIKHNGLDIQFNHDLSNSCFIFFGYSLSDINVTYFLDQIRRLVPTNNKGTKIYYIELCSRSNLNAERIKFYNEHKMSCFVPILTDTEQVTVSAAITSGDKARANAIFKDKIIKFLESI